MIGALMLWIPRFPTLALAVGLALLNCLRVGLIATFKASLDGKLSREEQTAIEVATWSFVWDALRGVPWLNVERPKKD